MDDWFDDRAARFVNDRQGCPEDQWTNKKVCQHCLAELLREAAKVGEGVLRDRVIEAMGDLYGEDSKEYGEIRARVEDL